MAEVQNLQSWILGSNSSIDCRLLGKTCLLVKVDAVSVKHKVKFKVQAVFYVSTIHEDAWLRLTRLSTV